MSSVEEEEEEETYPSEWSIITHVACNQGKLHLEFEAGIGV